MAANTDKLRAGASGISTTLSTSISNTDTTLTPASISNIPTVTAVDITVDRVDSSGTLTPSKLERMIGVVSGGNLVTVLRGQDNTTAQPHSTGAVIEMIPTGKWSQDIVTWGLAHANQDGSLIGSAVRTALGETASTGAGWTALGFAPNTVTYNGNRSYDLVFNTLDLTPTVSNGMRLRTTRTVTAPTQCTSLNGTTQYYSKSSPAGMTFTDDFVVSAWVKLTSYAVAPIVSRYNGTSGFLVYADTTGQIFVNGYNAGAPNFSSVRSYQSIPLNKWVHIAVQLDMSAFTATTTTSYIMIDGVDVPAFVTRSGTNPTALVQAGNLEIGSYNGGTSPFPGKIAQAAVFNAKVTQATMRGYISQGLAGTETSLISAYSFNNSINDLNTTNANNLTANGSAVATNADSPFSGQASGLVDGLTDYAEVLSAVFSTNTTVTVKTTDVNTIPTSGGVSAVSYSSNYTPYGYPNATDRTLSYVQIGGAFSTTSGSFVDVPGLTSTVVVPTGGRRLEFNVDASAIQITTTANFWSVALVEDGTVIQQWYKNQDTSGYNVPLTGHFSKSVTPGSHTYKVQAAASGGTLTFGAGATSSSPATSGPASLLVKFA